MPQTARGPVGACTVDGESADAFTAAAVRDSGVDAGGGWVVVAREGRPEGYATGG